MQIVIDISEDVYTRLLDNGRPMDIADGIVIDRAIHNGIPLPKGHGDLKDNDTLDTIFLNATNSPNKKLSYEEISNLILDAPTVIEADKENE